MKIFLTLLFISICILTGTYILHRVQTGQEIIPGFAANGDVVQIDDRDPRFTFTSGPARIAAGHPTWDTVSNGQSYVLRGGTAMQCNGLNSIGCFATLDLTGASFAIDQVTLGFSTGPNRTSADIYVDDKKVGEVDSYATSYTLDYHNYKLWSSPQGSFTCGKHKIKIVPNQRTGTSIKTFTLDFADVRTCTPAADDGGGNNTAWQKIENTDSRINYGGNNPSHQNLPFWDLYSNGGLSGGSANACRTDVNGGCQAVVSLTTNFSQVGLRALKGFNASSADIFIDNQKIGEADAYQAGSDGIGTTPLRFLDWKSTAFSCGTHTIKIVPNGRTGQNAKSFTFDYLQIKPCTPSGGGGNETSYFQCVNNACKKFTGSGQTSGTCLARIEGAPCGNLPDTQTYVVCQNNACAASSDASANDPACSGLDIGDTCGAFDEDLICQGNTDAPTRCFDCKKDAGGTSSTSEINILDFSCFAKFYGKEVGKN